LAAARGSIDLGMSLAVQLAVESIRMQFEDAMIHCDNLVKVHQRAGTGERGRRHIETSVNRAIIVVAIASWQAVVQDIVRDRLREGMPKSTDPNYGFARLIEGQVLRELDRFSTPNAENSRNLLRLIGFDPRPYWTWRTRDGGGAAATLSPAQVEERLRDWLKVRHAIAHGDAKMPSVAVLQAVRQGNVQPDEGPTIRLYDAKQCIAFVKKLTDLTLDGLEAEIA
jgi:hypothetical protein